MNEVPSIRARVEELISVARGLHLELEATRKQIAFVGETAQHLLKSTLALKSDPRLADQLKH